MGGFAGLLIDVSQGQLIGFTALYLCLCCGLVSALFRQFLRKNFINYAAAVIACTFAYLYIHYFFYYRIWEYEGYGLALSERLLPSALKTLLWAPVWFVYVWLITKLAGKKKTHFDASEKQKLTAQNVKEHIVVIPDSGGKIRVESVNKQYGHPEYRGIFEIDLVDKALHIINELPLEEYLYSVVPSEMPTEYQKEALKAQAVCARSYAIKQMAGKRLAALGAHVDDSVSFQVYNNLREDAASIAAVNETKGQVVFAENQVAETYFYSVSAGVSAGIKEVWFAKKDRSYLMPCVLLGDSRKTLDLQKEADFSEFLQGEIKSYDTNSPWYRWRTTVSEKQLQQFISEKIKSRYEKNPTQIQTKQKDGTFFSTGQTELGEIKKVEILKRGKSGVAVMAQITGSKNTLRIYTEYNLRNLFGGEKLIYLRKDKKEVSGLSCLPSGYFTIEKKGDSYIFTGGGYGHGVGMSQNGANQMAAQGKKCEEILKFYFLGSILQYQKSV